MIEFESEAAGTTGRPSATYVTLVIVLAVSFGVLLVATASPVVRDSLAVRSDTLRAAGIVGVVLAEALALDVGYGALVAIVEPSIRELLGGDSAWNSSD